MATQAEKQSPSQKWLEPGSANHNDETLLLAKEASGESERLRQLAHESLGDFDVNQHVQVTKDGLLKQLAGVELHGALSAKLDWTDARQHGVGKFGATVQRFATGLAKFMGAYSGIVEAVKNAGGPYGTAGYQAISVLLIVAVNKSKNDDFITKELEKMANCFPRINLLDDIYPDSNLKRYLLEIHSRVIVFSREASQYFLHASKRIRKSLQPQEQVVHGQVENIKNSLFEFNAWATVFLHQRIGELAKSNKELLHGKDALLKGNQELLKGNNELLQNAKELKNKNTQLLQEVAELKRANELLLQKVVDLESNLKAMETRDLTRERQTDIDNLEKVRRSLRQEDENLDEKLVEYRRNLEAIFPTTLDTRKPAAKYLQMSLQLLEEQPCYRKWWQNDKGCLLLMSGITVPEGQKQACGYSWLSPAASDLTERIRRDEGLVAFFNCHPTFELQPDEEPLVTEVVAGLLFQILKSQPQTLRKDYERRSGNLQIEAWSKPKVKDTLEVMLGSVIDILQGISDKGWTYFIIDRADRCKVRLLWLLEWLHKVVSHPGCRVKVFVVWDSNHSNMDPQDWESFEDTANGRIYSKLRWYQDRIQSFDKSPLRTPLIRFESNESQHSRSFE